eukprot:TRINITY_DN38323_c0_g1_i1.p1 TRINITY_DN38323_c0_g1~~TRINITY_DN38323_c0_g1_i1.p1  ORF type:complete len:153 (+),score=22.55 TRINITY_DN38323_c0_g1_i1:202-660(+)
MVVCQSGLNIAMGSSVLYERMKRISNVMACAESVSKDGPREGGLGLEVREGRGMTYLLLFCICCSSLGAKGLRCCLLTLFHAASVCFWDTGGCFFGSGASPCLAIKALAAAAAAQLPPAVVRQGISLTYRNPEEPSLPQVLSALNPEAPYLG